MADFFFQSRIECHFIDSCILDLWYYIYPSVQYIFLNHHKPVSISSGKQKTGAYCPNIYTVPLAESDNILEVRSP